MKAIVWALGIIVVVIILVVVIGVKMMGESHDPYND